MFGWIECSLAVLFQQMHTHISYYMHTATPPPRESPCRIPLPINHLLLYACTHVSYHYDVLHFVLLQYKNVLYCWNLAAVVPLLVGTRLSDFVSCALFSSSSEREVVKEFSDR